MTTLPAPASAQPQPLEFTGLIEQLQTFITEAISLDPEQAALRGGLSVLVLAGALLLIWGLRLLFKAVTERFSPQHAEGVKAATRAPIGRWTLRIARIAVFITALLIILRVWGFDLENLSEGPVAAILNHLWRIALIIVLSLAAIEISQLAIRHLFGRVAARSKNVRRAAQVRTLAPVLTGVSTTTLVIVATMMTLSEVGVEIGPLLAGAGIIGLAIGFGAQTIVKDFLTGIFLIIEDAVSVGDVVMIADFGGVVEEMSIRTIKLRDFDGTLHIFPYSEAQVIHNRTKNFSFAVFSLQVAHTASVAEALELMKSTGDTLKAEEAFAPFIESPIEVVGVDAVTDTGVMLKARIKTAPGKQWMIQREYLRRIKLAFDEAGIDVPTKTTVLVMPDQPPR
jgi:small conductance mechanosensitive channel